MGHPGLEPGTNRLKAEYSTIELATQILNSYIIYLSIQNCTLIILKLQISVTLITELQIELAIELIVKVDKYRRYI